MKVALLSFHNAYNYGAALQAYGLQCAINSLGVECEYINYVNNYRKNAYDMVFQFKSAIKEKKISRSVKVLIGMPFIRKRGRAFDSFYAKNLRKTLREYHSSEEIVSLNTKYDRFIVGSDQVWNPENNGCDMAFLLDFVDDSKKKISYSSSFGISSIPCELKDRYAQLLSDFACLAVREKQAVELVKLLTEKEALLVLDPVFLAGKQKWDELRGKDNWKQKKKYVFFYTNRATQVDDFLMSGFSMKGLEKHILSSHVTPMDFLNQKTKVCTSMSPERFLNEVANSEFVVTASFHCLAFAIIFHRKFCVLLTGDYGKDERILSLLNILGLEDRILRVNTTLEELEKDIDYSLVDEKLSIYYNISFDYLKQAIFDGAYKTINDNKFADFKYFCNDSRCTGCTACAYVCPTKAISIGSNEEGFEVPIRNIEKCNNCGKCEKVCQVFHLRKSNVFDQKYYAVKNSDAIRRLSSSGGCFTAISDYVLKQSGIVCAASLNNNFTIQHVFANNDEQRNCMRGTFYVQSHLGDCFDKIEKYLKNGKLVFFVGTPCQVKGLKCAIGDNENLITCDIICHGVPSPLVFKHFITFLKKKGQLTNFKFRDKEVGYKGYTVSATYNKTKISKKLWLNSLKFLFYYKLLILYIPYNQLFYL